MKKLIITILVLVLALPVSAQKVYRSEVLKSYRSGTMKLYETEGKTYSIIFKTGNRFTPTFPCVLGDRENALRLLEFLRELKLGDDDMVDLENETKNWVKRGLWGSLRIISEGNQFSYDITKKEIKGMIEIIEKEE